MVVDVFKLRSHGDSARVTNACAVTDIWRCFEARSSTFPNLIFILLHSCHSEKLSVALLEAANPLIAMENTSFLQL